MFTRQVARVPVTVRDAVTCISRFLAHPDAIIAATHSLTDGWVAVGEPPWAKPESITVQTLPPVTQGPTTRLAMRWLSHRAADSAEQEQFEFNVEFSEEHDGQTKISLISSYLPPPATDGCDSAVIYEYARTAGESFMSTLTRVCTAH